MVEAVALPCIMIIYDKSVESLVAQHLNRHAYVYTVDSLYKHASETRISCHAYIEYHTKSTNVLITELTCTEKSMPWAPKTWCLYCECAYKASIL